LTWKRFRAALLIYLLLGLVSLPFVTDATLRLCLWIFLGGLAVKSYLAVLHSRSGREGPKDEDDNR